MKAPSVAFILHGGKGPAPDDEPDGDESDSFLPKEGEDDKSAYEPSEEAVQAGEEAMAAMKKGDAAAFTKALCALVDLHAARDEEDSSERDKTAGTSEEEEE